MIIYSLQKISLIDYPKKIACTIFLHGCNFRCGFCHNPELVLNKNPKQGYSQEEILNFLKKRKKYLDAVCITGGEPLINNDLKEFILKIKNQGYLIKLDTNGTNSKLLKELVDNKLINYIAMDIKSDKENYEKICQIKVDLNKIEESIKTILNSNIDYEFRTTVIKTKHNKKILENIAFWIESLANKKPKKFCIQNFVARKGKLLDKEYEKIDPFTEQELKEMKKQIEKYFDVVEIRN
jgi:pyruvate formate lyase activating enzyme